MQIKPLHHGTPLRGDNQPRPGELSRPVAALDPDVNFPRSRAAYPYDGRLGAPVREHNGCNLYSVCEAGEASLVLSLMRPRRYVRVFADGRRGQPSCKIERMIDIDPLEAVPAMSSQNRLLDEAIPAGPRSITYTARSSE